MHRASKRLPVKPFVGSSDITALHLAFRRLLGIETFFGPTVAGPILGNPEPSTETLESLRNALFEKCSQSSFSGDQVLVPGIAGGIAIGGTLTIISSFAGTPELPAATGAVVLLEDVGESPYRIDRMLTQLLRSNWFNEVAGIACGSWERCGGQQRIHSVLLDRLSGLGVPIVTGLPFGHGEIQMTIPLGAEVQLDGNNGTLQFVPREIP